MSKPTLSFVTGSAGTGKSYRFREKMSNEPKFGTLCATTGIAAVNLSGASDTSTITTINSLLKYFDADDMQEKYVRGKLVEQLEKLLRRGNNLVIDEISMFSDVQLDTLVMAMKDLNELKHVQDRGGLNLIVTGDYMQLPPVKGKYAFHANCWKEFEIERLTKIWRQTDPCFLESINAARYGDGDKCAEILYAMSNGGIFRRELDINFDGTTIYSKNRDVDKLNEIRLAELLRNGNTPYTFQSYRWGQQRQEWRLIPDELVICKDAYVMILSNDSPEFTFANGDCGHVVEGNVEGKIVYIKLGRNSNEVAIKMITRRVTSRDLPDGMTPPEEVMNKTQYREYLEEKDTLLSLTKQELAFRYRQYLVELTSRFKGAYGTPYFDYEEGKWIVGEISYIPLRLAYAATVHKTQGLTLDKVQIDPNDGFFGQPSMSYVALSRCRSANGLRIVGSPNLLANRTNISEEVLRWI